MILPSLIAVDIGNARIKIGHFQSPGQGDAQLPLPQKVLALDGSSPQLDELAAWLDKLGSQSTSAHDLSGPFSWYIASVNRAAATCLIDWLRENRPDDAIALLSASDLPLETSLEFPDLVGVDRLVDAVAANRLRRLQSAAVVVDVGTAITVDFVSAEGVFCGGAILPGIAMAARAMHEFTDLLPLVEMSDLNTKPPAVGTSTEAAMRSGMFWGAVGSIRQLVEQMSAESTDKPQVIITGGAGPTVASLLGSEAIHVPHLTLSGIAITALVQE